MKILSIVIALSWVAGSTPSPAAAQAPFPEKAAEAKTGGTPKESPADSPTNAPPGARPTRSKERLRIAPPESRDDSAGTNRSPAVPPVGPPRDDLQKLRQELRNVSPAERGARMQQLWERSGKGTNSSRKMSPEEWQAKRVEFKDRLTQKAEALRTKRAEGTLTDAEQKQLARMEELLKRFQANADLGTPSTPPPQPARPQAPWNP